MLLGRHAAGRAEVGNPRNLIASRSRRRESEGAAQHPACQPVNTHDRLHVGTFPSSSGTIAALGLTPALTRIYSPRRAARDRAARRSAAHTHKLASSTVELPKFCGL